MIRLEVHFNMIPTEEGGRRSPIYNSNLLKEEISTYNPNLVFGYSGQLSDLKKGGSYQFANNIPGVTKSIDGKVFPNKEELFPGESTNAEIVIRDTNYIDEFLTKGMAFLVREGGRVIATGKILKVLELPYS